MNSELSDCSDLACKLTTTYVMHRKENRENKNVIIIFYMWSSKIGAYTARAISKMPDSKKNNGLLAQIPTNFIKTLIIFAD